jgi:hypothetical protein
MTYIMSSSVRNLPARVCLAPEVVPGRSARRRARADHDAVLRAAILLTGRSVAGASAAGIDSRCWGDLLAAADDAGWIDTALLLSIVRTHRPRMTTDATSAEGYERLGRYARTIADAEAAAGGPLTVDEIVALGVPRTAARRWRARATALADGFEVADSRDDFEAVNAESSSDVLDRLGLAGSARDWAESVLDDDDRFADTPAGTIRVWRSRARDQIGRSSTD